MTDTARVFRVDAHDDPLIDEVAALEAECFTNPWTRDMLANELRNSPCARLYALREGRGPLVGFCACWLVAGELHVNTMAIAPRCRRRGLGTVLLQAVMADAAASGAERATLEVRRSNVAAIRLYASLGFAVEAERPNYYTHPQEDALILWNQQLTLPNPSG